MSTATAVDARATDFARALTSAGFVDLRGFWGGWGIKRFATPTGNVGFIWRSPAGTEHKIPAAVSEREALKSAIRWWLVRSATIEGEMP